MLISADSLFCCGAEKAQRHSSYLFGSFRERTLVLGKEVFDARLQSFEQGEVHSLVAGDGVGARRGGEATGATRVVQSELQSGDGVLPLVQRPLALQHQFEDVARLKEMAGERLLLAVRVHLGNGHGEVLDAQTAEKASQLAPEAFAEENVQVALRGGVADHQELGQLVQVLEDAMVKGDVHVSVRIVGEEGGEGNGRHDADQVDGDDDHQHVGQVVAFLLVRVDLPMTSTRTCQGFDQMVIQFENHQERNDANEKAIEEQRDRQAVSARLADLAQPGDPEDRRRAVAAVARRQMLSEVVLMVIVLDDRMTLLRQALGKEIGDGEQQTDRQGAEGVATRAPLFAGEGITDGDVAIHGEADGDPRGEDGTGKESPRH